MLTVLNFYPAWAGGSFIPKHEIIGRKKNLIKYLCRLFWLAVLKRVHDSNERVWFDSHNLLLEKKKGKIVCMCEVFTGISCWSLLVGFILQSLVSSIFEEPPPSWKAHCFTGVRVLGDSFSASLPFLSFFSSSFLKSSPGRFYISGGKWPWHKQIWEIECRS